MSCLKGYPLTPCPFGYEGRVTRSACGTCRFYSPPQHILAWCMLWDREKVLCMRPKADCATCPEKFEGTIERDKMIDWRDPEAVRKYYRTHYDPSKAAEKMRKFLDKNPGYFKKYQEDNRAKVNQSALRWYHKNKQKKAEAERARLEQGTGKIPGDPP